jgi:hypothetical protein
MGRLSDKVNFSLITETGFRIGVASYDDLRNGDYDELLHFGRIPTDAQRKVWMEKEGGPNADKQIYKELQETGAPPKERQPTVSEVRDMIDQAARDARSERDQSKKPRSKN